MIEKEYAKALWDLALEENKCELFRDYFATCNCALSILQSLSKPNAHSNPWILHIAHFNHIILHQKVTSKNKTRNLTESMKK